MLKVGIAGEMKFRQEFEGGNMIEVGEYVRTKNKGIKKIDTILHLIV